MREVIVVGGGIAGLAAAARLRAAGRDVVVLEAQARLGGRILTWRAPGWPIPIELGAEFVHGRPPGLWGRLRLGAVPDRHWLKGQQLVDGRRDWERLQQQLSRPPEREMAFSERKLPRSLGQMARMFVEGFHAAVPERVSAMALHQQIGADESYRVLEGYDALVRHFAADVRALLGCPVTRIVWRPGHVEVRAGDRTFSSEKAVITVPLALLKAGAIAFQPRLVEHEAAAQALEVGSVVKVVLRFVGPFWQHHEQRLGPLGFVHQADARIPTWWTPRPFEEPILVGWAGGPRADALAGRSVLDDALASLAGIFEVPRPTVERALAGWLLYDWGADPFARGAYSWVPVNSLPAQRALAAPVAETLFFAGEATDWQGTSATVHGALGSGERAAAEVLASFASASAWPSDEAAPPDLH
jgi:monoamine oxidase